jgi:hypothetical protein
VTPYWFPSQTSSGAIREDRLVFPIPPGTSWGDVMPRVLPAGAKEKKMLTNEERSGQLPTAGAPKPQMPKRRFVQFGPPPSGAAENAETVVVNAKPKREKKPKQKNDPKLIAAARELRDRWLEQVNGAPLLSQGKYDVSRPLQAPTPTKIKPTPLLGAA